MLLALSEGRPGLFTPAQFEVQVHGEAVGKFAISTYVEVTGWMRARRAANTATAGSAPQQPPVQYYLEAHSVQQLSKNRGSRVMSQSKCTRTQQMAREQSEVSVVATLGLWLIPQRRTGTRLQALCGNVD